MKRPWYMREITPDMARRYGKRYRLVAIGNMALAVGFLLLGWKIATTVAASFVLLTLLEAARCQAWAEGVELGERRARKALGVTDDSTA